MRVGDAEFMDRSLRKSVPLATARHANQSMRQELEREVEEFLRRGGKVTVLPGYTPAPLPPHRAPQQTKDCAQQDDAVRGRGRRAIPWPESFDIQHDLFSARLTYKQLAELTGVPRLTLANWFQKHMIPSNAWKTRIADGLQTLLAKHGKSHQKTQR